MLCVETFRESEVLIIVTVYWQRYLNTNIWVYESWSVLVEVWCTVQSSKQFQFNTFELYHHVTDALLFSYFKSTLFHSIDIKYWSTFSVYCIFKGIGKELQLKPKSLYEVLLFPFHLYQYECWEPKQNIYQHKMSQEMLNGAYASIFKMVYNKDTRVSLVL